MEDLERLLNRIEERCDPDEIIDVLGLSSSDLVEICRGHIIDKRGEFEDYLDIYEGDDYNAGY